MSGQLSLSEFEQRDESPDDLTEAEADVFDAVENGPYGVREYARETDRAPGTVGNLLSRAWEKMGGSR